MDKAIRIDIWATPDAVVPTHTTVCRIDEEDDPGDQDVAVSEHMVRWASKHGYSYDEIDWEASL